MDRCTRSGRHRVRPLALVTVACALQPACSCRSRGESNKATAAVPSASAPPPAAPSVTASAEAARSPSPPDPALQALLCGARPLCTLLSQLPAGKDPRTGRDRLIASVRIGEQAADRDDDCKPHEAWLVLRAPFEAAQLLVSDCSRENPWPVEVKIGENTATIGLGGTEVPSNWVGMETVVAELAPPRLARKEWSYFFRLEGCHDEDGWREANGFSGEISWRRPAARGEQADAGCTLTRAFVPIPVVPLPADFEGGGWKTTSLGDCSTRIDGTNARGRGYGISGAAHGAPDAAMNVVLSDTGALYLELTDDHAGASPGGDQVQIFRSPETDDNTRTPGTPLPKPAQWTLDVADARVRSAVNAPASALQVERAEGPLSTRLRVRFARIPSRELVAGGLAVAYRDVDPDEPPSVTATCQSPLGHPSTLGRTQRVDKDVTCRAEGTTLVRASTPKTPTTALYRYDEQ